MLGGQQRFHVGAQRGITTDRIVDVQSTAKNSFSTWMVLTVRLDGL
jgi:hypothetical protein